MWLKCKKSVSVKTFRAKLCGVFKYVLNNLGLSKNCFKRSCLTNKIIKGSSINDATLPASSRFYVVMALYSRHKVLDPLPLLSVTSFMLFNESNELNLSVLASSVTLESQAITKFANWSKNPDQTLRFVYSLLKL